MSGVSKRKQNDDNGSNDVFSELDQLDNDDGNVDGLRHELDRMQRSYGVVESLLDVSTSLTSTLDLTELLEKIVDSILDLTGCQRGCLMLRGADGSLTLDIVRGVPDVEWDREELEISKTVVGEVSRTLEPIFSSNVMEMKDVAVSESIHLLKIHTVVCLPLEFEGDLVGVIYADSKFVSDKFLDSDVRVMNAFAAQAAVAINNARRHGELKLQREELEEQNISLRHKLGEEFAT